MNKTTQTNLKAKRAINKLTLPITDADCSRTLNVYNYTLEVLDEIVKAVNS
jgi:hypothetical protein